MRDKGEFLFTSESVSEGHPDKVADRISDTVLDAYLREDPYSRVACETLVTTNRVVLAGETRGPETVTPDLLTHLTRMAVHDIGIELADEGHDAHPDQNVVRRRFAVNGNSIDAELQSRRNLRKRFIRALAAGEAVGQNPDIMTAIDLTVGEIENVPEDATDRRADSVQDAKRPVGWRRHDRRSREAGQSTGNIESD